MLRVALGAPALRIITDQINNAGIEEVQTIPPRLKIPTDARGKVWVHFSKPERDIYVPAKDVLEGTVAPDRIAGKLVLVGTSAIGLRDNKTTPVDPAMPGVEVHAQLIEAAKLSAPTGFKSEKAIAEEKAAAEAKAKADAAKAKKKN